MRHQAAHVVRVMSDTRNTKRTATTGLRLQPHLKVLIAAMSHIGA